MNSGRAVAQRYDGGASLVEFALILPVFAMLLFGMISAGLALNEKQQITHATREGARYAATVPTDQDFDNSADWATNVQQLIIERSIDSLAIADVCVSLVEGSDESGTLRVVDNDTQFTTRVVSGTPVPCIADQDYPTASSDNGRRVQVSARKDATIDLIIFGSHEITMNVEATALSEPSP